MKIKALFLVVVFLVSGFAGVSSAADPAKQTLGKKEGRWVNIFPIGTEIHSFAIDPQNEDTIYASTYKGLFKSVDGGKFWSPLSYPHRFGKLNSSIIVIDPSSSKTLYWAWKIKDRQETGLLRSKDGGVSWDDISAGVVKDEVYDIAIHPKTPEIIYVASGGGLYKTLNGGKTWGKIAGIAYSVFLNPESPDEVYTSVKYGYGISLFSSKDGGQNFDLIQLNTLTRYGEAKCDENDEAFALLYPLDSKRMLVACNHGGGGQSISKSSDGGKTWEFIHWEKFVPEAKDEETAHIVRDIIDWLFHPKDKNVIYFVVKMKEFTLGGDREWADKILKSTDGGSTFTPLPSPPQLNIGQIVALSDAIYVTTDYGIYKTTDDGKTWESRSFGLPVKMERKELMGVDTKTDSIYVGDDSGGFGEPSGYWTSSDKGLSWEKSQVEGLKQLIVTNDQTTYIGREVSIDYWSWRLHIDKLAPNQRPVEIKISGDPKYLVVSPSNSQILYVIDNKLNGLFLKSEDAGFSWTQIDWPGWMRSKGEVSVRLLQVDSLSPHILYAVVDYFIPGVGTSYPSLVKTTDGGNTWMDISRGLYNSIASAWTSSKWLNPKERYHMANLLLSSPTSVVIDPSNSNMVYITTSKGGVYRSDDGGKTWKSKSMAYLKTLINQFDNYSVQQCKGRKNCKVTLDIALARRGRGIIMMTPQNTVIVDPEKVLDKVGLSYNNIAVDPSNPKTIYLATNKGVYRSFDRGDSWQLVNNGLLDTTVKKVMASTSLVLAEGESGIYKLSE